MAEGIMLMAWLAAGLILIGVVTGAVLRGWMDGGLSCIELVGGGACILVFIGLCLRPGAMPWSLAILGLPVLYLGVAVRLRLWQRRLGQQLRQEEYARCERVLARDPRNAAALARLGELLEEDGRLHEALETYEACLAAESVTMPVRFRLQRLRERVALQESGQTRCASCSTIQPLVAGACWKCGTAFDRVQVYQYRLTRMGAAGRYGLVALLGACCLVLSGVAAAGTVRWVLITLGILAAAGSAAWLTVSYRRLLREAGVRRRKA